MAFKIAAIVAILYEVAFNLFLLSGGLSRVTNFNPDALLIEYRSGWSIVPGFVHARGLRIRSKDNNIEFDLRIDRCVFHVRLHELIHQRFHVTDVSGEGISFVSRLRITPDKATALTLGAIPHIEGLEEVPIKGPETPPPDDAHYHLWTVALDRVDARSVREVWIDTFRLTVHADVVGSFYLKPTRWAHVGPATAYIHTGHLVSGNDVIADLDGRFEVTVDGFDPRVTGGIDVLRKASPHLIVDTKTPSLGFTHRYAGASPSVALTQGELSASIDVRIDHGRIAAARVEADAWGIRADLAKAALTGEAHVSVQTGAGAADPLEAVFTARDLHLVPRGFDRAAVEAGRAEVTVRSAELDLVEHPFSDAAVSARVPVAAVSDLGLLAVFLPKDAPVHVQGGRGTVGADFDLAGGVGRGHAALALSDVRVLLGETETVAGQVRAALDLRHVNLAAGRADISGTRVEVLSVRTLGGTQGWWANVDLPESTLEWRRNVSWRASVIAQARDTRPFAFAIADIAHLPTWLTPLLCADDLKTSAGIGIAPGAIDVRGLVAKAGSLHVEATFLNRAETSRALAVVGTGPLAIGLKLGSEGTGFQLTDAERWYKEQTAGPMFR
jgi:hypothetical protein